MHHAKALDSSTIDIEALQDSVPFIGELVISQFVEHLDNFLFGLPLDLHCGSLDDLQEWSQRASE